MMSEVLAEALRLAGLGFAVLPIWPTVGRVCRCPLGEGCGSPGKHPVLRHGVKEATRDAGTIREWWRRWPGAWLAVATGEPSGGRWVLDVDVAAPVVPDGAALGVPGLEALAQLQTEHGLIPAGMRTRTGSGGLHVWFVGEGGHRNRARVRLDGRPAGIDVRGTGGYVLVPPSGHSSGGRYAWEGEGEIEAPGWLLDWLRQDRPEGPRVVPARAAGVGGSGGTEPRIVAWGRQALAREVAGILAVDGLAGARHRAIVRAAFTVGGYLWALDATAAEEALVEAGVYVYGGGQGVEKEVRRAVADGLRDGALRPMQAPEDRPHPRDVALGQLAAGARSDGWVPGEPDLTVPEDLPPAWGDEGQAQGEGQPESGAGLADDGGGYEGEPEPPPWTPPPAPARPRIVVGGQQLRQTVEAAWAALALTGQLLWQQGGRVVALVPQTDGPPQIEEVGEGRLLAALAQAADWVKVRPPKKGEVTADGVCYAPADIPRQVLAAMLGSPPVGLPALASVLAAPCVVAGEGGAPVVLDRPGYHAPTASWMHGPLPVRPAMGVAEAVGLLRGEWLGEVAWASGPTWPGALEEEGGRDEATALGWLLMAVCRRAIRGPVPALWIEATISGAGKSALAKSLLMVATGSEPMARRLASVEEQRRTAILAAAEMGGALLFDNVRIGPHGGDPLQDPTLEGLLTAWPRYGDRRLGTAGSVVIDTRAMLCAVTSQGGGMNRDLERRFEVVRLDPRVERSDQIARQRPGLEAWTSAHLGRLQAAVLTVLAAGWADLGRELPGERRVQDWAATDRLIRGGLRVLGLSRGWCAQDATDQTPQEAAWRHLIAHWVARGYDDRARVAEGWTASEVARMAADCEAEIGLEPGSTGASAARVLRVARGRTWVLADGRSVRLVQAGRLWRLEGADLRAGGHVLPFESRGER